MKIKPIYANGKLRIPEGTLVILSGLPGSGKSHLKTNRSEFIERATWLSADDVRDAISPPVVILVDGVARTRRYEGANDAVFAILRHQVQAGLRAGRTVVLDATSPTDSDREPWVTLADSMGAPHVVVIVPTALETCLERARNRTAHVPENAIRNMAQPAAAQSTPVNGKVQACAPPQGFQATSRFNHHVLLDSDVLEFTWKELPGGRWDVVGDVHGLFDELVALLTKAGWTVEAGKLLPHPEGRKLLLLGDLVDRGPKSLEVVRFVKKAVDCGLAMAIKGNHEAKLVRFIENALSEGIEKWTSYASAETGMTFLKVDSPERDALVAFMKQMPNYLVDEASRTVFLHANVTAFQPGASSVEDTLHGMSGWNPVDSDALYQEGVQAGINGYTLIRGHIPQTSEQGHAFSLERQSFQRGELVLLRFDAVSPIFAQTECSQSRIRAFNDALITQQCTFDFAQHAKRFALIKGLTALAENKHVVRARDASGMLSTYKYSKQTFWNNSWGESPLLFKARGLVLDPAGTIVSHPFDKVFNYLENDTGKDLPDSTPVVQIEKLNGFLGVISAHPLKRGDLLVHTQGSFGGDFVGYIQDFLVPALKGHILKFLSRNDVTLMFEVLHEKDPHIIEYDKAMLGLHLIGVRAKEQNDLAWSEAEVDMAASAMGLRRPSWERTSFGKVRKHVRASTGEGCMVRADTPNQEVLLKMKTPYYLTTKFLGRLSAGRTKHLFANPQDFKRTIDEEFYVLVDTLIAAHTVESFLALGDNGRVVEVRQLIDQLQ